MRSVSKSASRLMVLAAVTAILATPVLASPRGTSTGSESLRFIRQFIHWILDDDPPLPPLSDRPSLPPG